MVAATSACGGGHDADPPVPVTATDGDPTGGDASEAGCLIEPEAGRTEFRYQCEGFIEIDIVVEGNFDGSPVMDSLPLAFGHGVDGDSYEEPHVMACCPELNPELPGCEQGHEQACMADLVEQGCKSIETNLRDFAEDEHGGPGIKEAVIRAAIHKIADHVETHQSDCIEEFVTNTGIGTTEPSCDPDGTGVEYDALLESGQWSFDPAGLVDNVTISVATASWAGVHPTSGALDPCTSGNENDDVLFLEIDPAPGSKRLRMASGSAVLHGPSLEIVGVAELESIGTGCAADRCSQLAIAVDRERGTLSLEDMQLRLAGTTNVGEASATITVDMFRVRLWDGTRAQLDRSGTTATIPPGGAWFVVGAASGELRGAVSATNETAIVLHEEDGAWTSSAFTLARRDAAGERWALAITPATWQ